MTDDPKASGALARVAVIGGGSMGSGIAAAFAATGAQVTVLERDAVQAEQAGQRIRHSIASMMRRRRSDVPSGSAPDGIATAVPAVTTDATNLHDVQLIIEAVPEDLQIKRDVLARAETFAPAAVLATNTSSLPIDAIAESLRSPERLIGLHFFNPVPRSDLVEIVIGRRTNSAIQEAAAAWVRALEKTPIQVSDSPGFATSRLGLVIALEAMRMVEEGVASAHDIDAAMRLGYRHKLGPLATSDLVGLDVRLSIADFLASEFGPRFEPPGILRRMVTDGRLGRKSGEGFFTYEN